MNGDYELIYDVTQAWPAVWFPAGGLLFIGVGLVMWFSGRRRIFWTVRFGSERARKAPDRTRGRFVRA